MGTSKKRVRTDLKGNSDPKDVPGVLHNGEGPGERGPFGARVGGDLACALVTHQPEMETLLCLHQLWHLKHGPQRMVKEAMVHIHNGILLSH